MSSSGLRTCSEAVCDELGPSVLRPTARAETRHLDHSLRREAATTCAGSSMAAGDDERRRRHSAEKRQRVIRPGCRSLGRLRAVRSAPRLLTRVSMPPRPRGGCLFCSRNRSRACLRLNIGFKRAPVGVFWLSALRGAFQTSGQVRSPPRPAPPRTSHACARRPDAQAPTLHVLTVDSRRLSTRLMTSTRRRAPRHLAHTDCTSSTRTRTSS